MPSEGSRGSWQRKRWLVNALAIFHPCTLLNKAALRPYDVQLGSSADVADGDIRKVRALARACSD